MPGANKLDFSIYDERTRKMILDYLNYLPSEGIYARVEDDPAQTTGHDPRHPDYGIGIKVAEAIIARRQSVGGIFTDLEQLAAVSYFGRDKLADVAYTVKKMNAGILNLLAPQTASNNTAEVFVNGPGCLAMLLDEINAASKYIHLSMMLFFNDAAGNQVADALIAAARRGVEVRVMVDSDVTASGYLGSVAVDTSGEADFSILADKIKTAGGKVVDTSQESYWEWQWDDKRSSLAAAGVPEEFLYLQDLVQDDVQANWNVANHRKFVVIDGVTSIIGSLNIGGQYLYTTPLNTTGVPAVTLDGAQLGIPADENEWHDGCFRIRGDFARLLNRLFASQWFVLGGDVYDWQGGFYAPEQYDAYGDDICSLFASFPGAPVNVIQQYFISLLRHSSGAAVIENPYLIDDVIWGTLQRLPARQAKQITICNPLNINDHLTNGAAIRCNMYDPFQRGVSYYDYSGSGRFSHWKIALDKGAGCVFHGSYNLNVRSARHDFEACVLVKSTRFAEKVGTLLDFDLGVSTRITDVEEFYEYPALHITCLADELTEYFS